jgi:hypothetical protein
MKLYSLDKKIVVSSVINSVPFTGKAIAICKAICSVKVLILSVMSISKRSIIGITVLQIQNQAILMCLLIKIKIIQLIQQRVIN